VIDRRRDEQLAAAQASDRDDRRDLEIRAPLVSQSQLTGLRPLSDRQRHGAGQRQGTDGSSGILHCASRDVSDRLQLQRSPRAELKLPVNLPSMAVAGHPPSARACETAIQAWRGVAGTRAELREPSVSSHGHARKHIRVLSRKTASSFVLGGCKR
jgi:hypothetical protein